MNYDELHKFTGSLTYSIRLFIFSVMAQCPPPKYITVRQVIIILYIISYLPVIQIKLYIIKISL